MKRQTIEGKKVGRRERGNGGEERWRGRGGRERERGGGGGERQWGTTGRLTETEIEERAYNGETHSKTTRLRQVDAPRYKTEMGRYYCHIDEDTRIFIGQRH